MTDLALVAAGIAAAMPQTNADLSPRYSAALQLQEKQLIQAILNAPRLQPKAALPSPWRIAVPQFSSAASSSDWGALPAGSVAPERSPAIARRAQIEARLRQLEQSALAQPRYQL